MLQLRPADRLKHSMGMQGYELRQVRVHHNCDVLTSSLHRKCQPILCQAPSFLSSESAEPEEVLHFD
jgi:hypothetical protein